MIWFAIFQLKLYPQRYEQDISIVENPTDRPPSDDDSVPPLSRQKRPVPIVFAAPASHTRRALHLP